MSTSETSWPYWSVDLPGLSREQAEGLLEFAERRMSLSGSTIDPSCFLTLHLDRDSVQSLSDALGSGRSSGIGGSTKEVVVGILEVLNDWLGLDLLKD